MAKDIIEAGMELAGTEIGESCLDRANDVFEGTTGIPLPLVFGAAGSVIGLIHEIYAANRDLEGSFSRLENTCRAVQACTKKCTIVNPHVSAIFELITLRLEDASALLTDLSAKRNRALFGILLKAPKYVAEAEELADNMEALLGNLKTLLEVDAPLHSSAAVRVISDDYALNFWGEKVGADKTFVSYTVLIGALADYCRDVGKSAAGLFAEKSSSPVSDDVSVFAFSAAVDVAGGWGAFLDLLGRVNPFTSEYARQVRLCAASGCERRRGGFYAAKAGMPRTRADKKYFYISSGVGLVLEPYGHSYAIERYIAAVKPSGSPFQQWYFTKQGLVRNRETGLVLGVVGNPEGGKWLVQLPKMADCPSVMWLFLEDGTISPVQAPHLVIDVDMMGKGADKVVMLYQRNGKPNQIFTLCNLVESAEMKK